MLKKISILTIIALTTNLAQASKKPRHEKPTLEKDREKKRHKAAMAAWQAARQVQPATSIAASPAANADKPANSVAATVAAETAVVQKQTSDRDTAVNAPEITIPQEVPLRLAFDPAIQVTALQNIILGYLENWFEVIRFVDSDPVNSISWSPDSKQLICTCYDKKTKKLWDVASGKVIQTDRADNQETPLIPRATYRCWAGGYYIYIATLENPEAGKCLTTNNDLLFLIPSAAAGSPDGNYFAAGSSQGPIKIWEIATGKEIKTLNWIEPQIELISWSPDSKYIASHAFNNETIEIWNVETGQIEKKLTGHKNGVDLLNWSPNGKYVASGSRDGTIIIWRKY